MRDSLLDAQDEAIKSLLRNEHRQRALGKDHQVQEKGHLC